MKPNPYVYPFIPFEDLTNKNIRENFIDQKTISLKDLKEIIQSIQAPRPKLEGFNISEKILSLFYDDNYRFGPLENIIQNKKFWLKRIDYFTSKNQPIQFTILGFPFKIPVPLKTNRILPDMGEVLSLLRLKTIADIIKGIYPPGAKITIFTEGVFGQSVGVSEKEAVAYREFLKDLAEILDFSSVLNFIDLSEMKRFILNFDEVYEQKIFELKELYNKGNPEFLKKYQGTFESLLHIVSTKNYDENLLLDVYNWQLKDEELSSQARLIREDIKKRAHEAIFHYHAFLQLRDQINYLEKMVPYGLALTVSPKPNRLGIIPVHKECLRLPYHGVPVYYPEKNLFLIEYLIDIKRRERNYTLIFFDQDKENKPFYYLAC
jgi:pyoverdine/dityrosine biosynthesis protein Dit1